MERGGGHERYRDLRLYVGDLHNHCGISYGHGSIEDAYANARLQLDFASVTGHASWHDMPRDDPRLRDVVAYHERGFERLARCWDHVQDVTASVHEDGRFVSFLSFEWHSLRYGDHCVYFNGDRGDIVRADSLDDLRTTLRGLARDGVETLAIPHHVGYRRGMRGINWATYTDEFSPVVEMMSMHGCGEGAEGPRPYLHTMGPRDARSTVLHGLRRGHVFGFIGSTDHHSAHPGSHGHGRVAVWAPELSRDGIWDAVRARRVYAITGDRIELSTSVGDAVMGEIASRTRHRRVHADVVGSAPLDYVEVVRNGDPLHRVSRHELAHGRGGGFRGAVGVTLGWGEVGVPVDWDVRLEVVGGRLLAVQPRLHGEDTVAPVESEPDRFQVSAWGRDGDRSVWLRTSTRGNTNVSTDGTQGLTLRIEGDDRTRVAARINDRYEEHAVGELRDGPRTGYLHGFLSGAYRLDRAVPDSELSTVVDIDDLRSGRQRDWYYVRVRQSNDQWAWSSPIWVEAEP